MPKELISETLPSGVQFSESTAMVGFYLMNGQSAVFVTEKDIMRMYGIIHPCKVRGKWTGDCGGRNSEAETTIKEQSQKQ